MRKKELKFIWEIIKPYNFVEILGFIVEFLSSLFLLLNPYLLKELIDNALSGGNSKKLLFYISLMILVFVGSRILAILNTYIFTYIGENILYKLRLKIHLISLMKKNDFSNEKQIGGIISKILNELPQMVNLISELLINLIIQFLTLVITVVIIFNLNRFIAIITMIVIPFIYLVFKIYNPKIKAINTTSMNEYSIINSILQENLNNKKGIKYHIVYQFAQLRFSERLQRYINIKYKNIFLRLNL